MIVVHAPQVVLALRVAQCRAVKDHPLPAILPALAAFTVAALVRQNEGEPVANVSILTERVVDPYPKPCGY